MSKIKVLPDSLANKIAAGEVVERPASAVKELLENSLDAGARRIDIEVEAGGKRLIRVVDDGEGMARDDAITAFERHATSKLRTADDLDAISTLGFRGEALPSIASVSRLILRTKAEAESEGTEVEFNGGKLVAVRDIAWPGGAEVEVRDLFFNIPARRKFLKSDSTEGYHITNLVQHYALANAGISFLLVSNGREAIRVTPASSLKERAYQVLGGDLLEKLIEVNQEQEGLRIVGFVSNPQEQRSSRDAQYLFVNRRFVRDQLIGRALNEAYRSKMPSGTHPAVVLFLELPHSEVDVNVHPAKTEVRFLHEHAILSFISGAVAEALKTTRPVTRLTVRDLEGGTAPRGRPGVVNGATAAAYPPVDARPPRDSLDPEFVLEPPSARTPAQSQRPLGLTFDAASREAAGAAADTPAEMPLVRGLESDRVFYLGSCGEAGPSATTAQAPFDVLSGPVRETALPGLGHGIKPLGQIRDSYIVATDEEGLLLIDQHVAHERVLFEQVRGEGKGGPVQPLLIPQTLDLTPAEVSAFEIVQSELESHGIETMQLSGRTIAIKTAPAGLGSADVVAVVRELLAVVEIGRRGFTIDHIRDAIAAAVACKAAIKINMPLTAEKMTWLIDELMKTRNPMTCPHGRPILMRFGLRDIERGFKRPV
ncbi:MAG TPA: DNA mismatch repair endonuclease MutL [Blastocatellia bacterium]|nr:DNA mismatch repair endonuclease MutL [Blastocatellia bacterium]